MRVRSARPRCYERSPGQRDLCRSERPTGLRLLQFGWRLDLRSFALVSRVGLAQRHEFQFTIDAGAETASQTTRPVAGGPAHSAAGTSPRQSDAARYGETYKG